MCPPDNDTYRKVEALANLRCTPRNRVLACGGRYPVPDLLRCPQIRFPLFVRNAMLSMTASSNRVSRPLLIVAILALIALLVSSLSIALPAFAQDATPAATPEAAPNATPEAAPVSESATVTPLFDFQLDAFPEAPVSIRLLRITLAPGASSPLHTHPGPEFDYVESGTLTAIAEGEATVVRDGEQSPAAAAGESLTEGQMIVFPPGTGMSLVNDGEADLVLLSAVFHPVSEDVPSTTYPGGDPAADAFEGVSFTVLGDGLVQEFPAGPATVTLETVTAPAGVELPGSDGVAMYSAVAGDFGFAVTSGDVQVSRTASPNLRPNAAPEQEFALAPGDAAFFPSGVSAISRTEQTGTVELLRLVATPSQAITGEPAEITYLGSPAAEASVPSDGTTADTAPTEIEVGATVVTNTDAVNLREEPSTDADGVDQLGEGIELEVIAGPEEADDFTWYQVEVVGTDGPTTGWVADEFIILPGTEPDAAVTDTPEAGTAEAPVAGAQNTPEAAGDDETFAEGDTVITNDENVRVRDTASSGGDIIEAFPAGTEFVIIGAPEEADGFVWYPVQAADDETITGWIVDDFLDAEE